MEIVIAHISLGIILFFIINWIGDHSYTIGYVEISVFVKAEDAPALNFLIRVLTPVVFIILVSTVFYYLSLDEYVYNIYLVNIYYILFRLMFNLLTNRGLLLNWYRQLLHWLAIGIISYMVYDRIISVKTNILPDFTTIANELWIIILVFVFQLTNNIRLPQSGSINRKKNYLDSRYTYFKNKYGLLIKELTKNESIEIIVFSILIYEDFNRPKLIRLLENLKQYFSNNPHTLGVMQVKSNKVISDLESVKLGTEKIMASHKRFIDEMVDGKNSTSIVYITILYQIIMGDQVTNLKLQD